MKRICTMAPNTTMTARSSITVDVVAEVSVAVGAEVTSYVVDVTLTTTTTIMFLVVAVDSVVVAVADSTDVVDAFRDQDPGLSDILRG